ncbi:MAG: glycosyltransferase [Acidobacteriota bacterium]
MNFLPACTIVSNNYLAFARVFAESYREHHPGADVYVCIADRPSPSVRYRDLPFKVVFAEDLGIPAFFNLAFRYGILELNTAVKPYLLAYLRDQVGLDRAFYFDPDILVLSPLEKLASSLDTHSAVLTPHITRELDDAYLPSERIIQMSGIYNLGFLGIRLDESTSAFLQWWQDRLYRFCLLDIHNGLFVDQKWMDFAPAFLPSVDIQRNPAYNIAYWNLPHRKLQRSNQGWLVDGERAGFFHFSGIVFDELGAISKYQSRVNAGTNPEVMPLFHEYRDRIEAADHDETRMIPYGFERFEASGVPVVPVLRTAFQRIDPYGLRWQNPFDDQCEDSYLAWLAAPVEFPDGWLTRAALCLWEERPDLTGGYPSPWGADLPAFADWLKRSPEEARGGVSEVLLRGVRIQSRRSVKSTHPQKPGILPFDASVPTYHDPLHLLDLSDPGESTSWLNEPVPTVHEWPVVTRLALKLYEVREDVQKAFPDPVGSDQAAFASWFILSAGPEYRLHKDLLLPIIRSLPVRERMALWSFRLRNKRPQLGPRTRTRTKQSLDGNHPLVRRRTGGAATPGSRTPGEELPEFKVGVSVHGVNLAGYFGTGSGMGQVARGSAEAISLAGIPVARIPLDVSPWARTFNSRVLQPWGAPFDVTLMHVNAEETPLAFRMIPTAAAVATYKIGYWFWELSHFPLQFADRFAYFDELWAPSRFCQTSFEVLSTIPVRYVRPCVLPPSPHLAKRSMFGMQDNQFYFTFAFDTLSIPERKNPFAAIDAFILAASRTRRDIGLIINVNHASHDRQLVQQLRDRARGANVIIHTDPLTRSSVESLLACSDAYLSLHRSEGLGLPPIEALYLRKPVVATNYGGVTDFLDSTTGFPVSFNLVQLDRAYPPYPAGAIWADPDVDEAASAMLRVVEDPAECSIRASAGFDRVTEMYGIDSAARRFAVELRRLFAQGNGGTGPSASGTASGDTLDPVLLHSGSA